MPELGRRIRLQNDVFIKKEAAVDKAIKLHDQDDVMYEIEGHCRAIIDSIDGKKTIEELMVSFASSIEADPKEISEDFLKLIDDFFEHKLIEYIDKV